MLAETRVVHLGCQRRLLFWGQDRCLACKNPVLLCECKVPVLVKSAAINPFLGAVAEPQAFLLIGTRPDPGGAPGR